MSEDLGVRPSFPAALLASLVIALLAGCGSQSSSGNVPAGSQGSAQSSSSPGAAASPGKPQISATACSLLTLAQVQALLGAQPADAGTERDLETNYKTCNWTTGSSAGNANSVRLGVVLRASSSASGFGPSTIGPAAPMSGVGDDATYASTGGGAGQFGESVLVANKGLASLSLDASYGGSIPSPASIKALMGDDLRGIFSHLGG